jgi:hypothetical protein
VSAGVRILDALPGDTISLELQSRVALLHGRREITLSFDYPPIPVRDFDWSAIDRNSYEPGAPIGRGPTAEAALRDLLDQIEEDEVTA